MKKLFIFTTAAALIASPAFGQQYFYGPFGQWEMYPEQGVSEQERTMSAQQDTGMYPQGQTFAYAPGYDSSYAYAPGYSYGPAYGSSYAYAPTYGSFAQRRGVSTHERTLNAR